VASQTVKRNSSPEQYDLPLKIVSYKELYGWSMDEIVKVVGTKNNCAPHGCCCCRRCFWVLPMCPLSYVSRSYPRGPCSGTFCGVFRRQALDRGAAMLKADAIVTGHNADDIAETVLMNCACGGPYCPRLATGAG